MFCVLIDLEWETFTVALVTPCQSALKSVAAFSQGLVRSYLKFISSPLHPAHETPLFLSYYPLDTLHKIRGESFAQIRIHSLMLFVLIS
jgi:hypothetical protein